MDKLTTHTGTAVPLRRSNVDTDQIIPAVYLKRVTRTGFEDGLFAAWRDLRRRHDPGGRTGVRDRLVPGTRRLGTARLGFPGSHSSPIR